MSDDHRAQGAGRSDRVRSTALVATILAAVATTGPVALAQAPGPPGAGGSPSVRNLAPSQQPGSPLPVVAGQMRTAAQSLRHAGAMVIAPNAPDYQAMARNAVSAGLAVVAEVPPQTPSGAARDAARLSLTRAEDLLTRPDRTPIDIAQQLVAAADALDRLAAQLVGNADGRAAPSAGSGR